MTDLEKLREAIARGIALVRGHDPDGFDILLICGPNNEPIPCWMAFEEEADAALAAIEAEGAKVVFREPTPEMLKAGWDTGTTKAPNIAYNVWTPMFDAAPSLTEPRKVERGPAGATYGSYDYEEKP
jgi:hypothetical protein